MNNNSIGKDVYFDNIKIEHYAGTLLEENHYYPYGLTVSQAASGATAPENPYKYQTIELERNFGLEQYETFYRGLNPQIGRFTQTDPKAEVDYSISPFASMRNNPISNTDPLGDIVRVNDQYREQLNGILQSSFGENAAKFSYGKEGNLQFDGNRKDLSREERKAFDELNGLMVSKTQYNVLFEESFKVEKTDGSIVTVNTGNSGSKGDAAVYPSGTKNGEGYLAVNPNSTQSNVIDVQYDANGNQTPLNFNDVLENNGKGPERTFTPYENFWHGVGHLSSGSSANEGKAMEVENMGGAIHKTIIRNSDGTIKNTTPNPIAPKPYNLDHPKK